LNDKKIHNLFALKDSQILKKKAQNRQNEKTLRAVKTKKSGFSISYYGLSKLKIKRGKKNFIYVLHYAHLTHFIDNICSWYEALFLALLKRPTPEHRGKYSGIYPEFSFNRDSKYAIYNVITIK